MLQPQINAQKNTPLFFWALFVIVFCVKQNKYIAYDDDRTDTSLNVFHMGELQPRWMRERVVFYSLVPTVCTCNSHRLSREWREPGHDALSALMMRQLEAIFQLGQALTLKHFWSTLLGLSMTRMDETTAMLNIHSNLI